MTINNIERIRYIINIIIKKKKIIKTYQQSKKDEHPSN